MQQPPKIFVIRHPQTQWNASGLVQGHLDSPLTEIGRCDADNIGCALADKGISAVYTSDLGRCVQTTGIILLRIGDVPVHATSELRERNFGILNGHSVDEFEGKLDTSDPHARPENGETLTEMTDRVKKMLERLLASEPGPLLVVTHDGPFRALQKSELGHLLQFIN